MVRVSFMWRQNCSVSASVQANILPSVKSEARRVRTLAALIALFPAIAIPGSIQPAIVLETAPYYEKPLQGQLPKGFIEKRDTCRIDSVAIDSMGNPWMRIVFTEKTFWVSAKNIRFLADISPDSLSLQLKGDDDRKRRLQILQNNSQWPHRVKMAVRAGQICLDMTEKQLIASWGRPVQSGAMFTIGVGRYDYKMFKTASGSYCIVTLNDGRVTGWSADR